MRKTTEAQERAQANYFDRLKIAGYKRVTFTIRPEWKQAILDYIKGLK